MKHTVERIKLANGAEGLLINVPDATVMTFEFNFRAGDYLVDSKKWETPHLMEHMLLGANRLYPKSRVFQAEFEKNGAYCNASTGVYDITYEAECADFEWQRIFELLLLAICEPLFLKEEFESELSNVREELSGRANNHFRHLSLAMRNYCGFIAITDRERLKRLGNNTLADIETHYRGTHTTSNLRFVIAGNLQGHRAGIERRLEKMKLAKGRGRIELPDEHPIKHEKALYVRNATVKNMYFILDTLYNGRLSEEEWDAGQLLNTMLTETFYSRILGTARERGLVYHINSGFSQMKLAASWWFGAQVLPSNAPALFNLINSEISRVKAGDIADEDIEAAKQYLLGRYQRSAQTVAGTAAGYTNRYYFEDSVDDYYAIPERIRAITKARIITTANEMFADNTWALGILGSAGREIVDELHDQLLPLWD